MSAATTLTPEQIEAINASQREATENYFTRRREERQHEPPPRSERALERVDAYGREGPGRIEVPYREGVPLVELEGRALAAAVPTLRPIELSALLDLDLPTPAPILGPILRPGSLVMPYGPAGVGKTFFGLGMAVAIAHGVPFLGWSVSTPQRVLYIDGEMSAAELKARCAALVTPIRETINHVWAPLEIITPDLQEEFIPNLDGEAGLLALLRIVDAAPDLAVIFIDNLSCLTAPEDDNSASSWSVVQNLLRALRRKEIAVVVLHHAGKNGNQRGTSRRTDILDVVLKLSPVPDTAQDGRTRVLIEFEKGRGLTADQKAPFTAVLEPHPAGGLTWTRTEAAPPVGDRIREMLADGMPAGEIATELHTARSFVYRIRTEMQAAGELPSGDKSARSAAVVPLSPSFRKGQGTSRRAEGRDRTGDRPGD